MRPLKSQEVLTSAAQIHTIIYIIHYLRVILFLWNCNTNSGSKVSHVSALNPQMAS